MCCREIEPSEEKVPTHSSWRPGRQGQGQSLKERREHPAAAQEKRISQRGPDTGLRAGRGWGCGWSQVGGVTGLGHSVTTRKDGGLALGDGQPLGWSLQTQQTINRVAAAPASLRAPSCPSPPAAGISPSRARVPHWGHILPVGSAKLEQLRGPLS